MENKKGIALNQAFGAVLVLVLIGILVIVGLFIFVNLSSTFTDTDSISVTAETITTPNITAVFVAEAEQNTPANCNFGSFAVVVTNSTGAGEIYPASNYVITDIGSIVVSSTVNAGINSTEAGWNLTYSAKTGGASCVASKAMITQFGTYPVLIGLIGTIIFLGLVIGVLVASFVFGGKKEGF